MEDIIKELHKVLKPNGYILITLPFAWNEHEIPYDYARYTSFGVKDLLTKSGFIIIKFEKTTNYVDTISQLWSVYMFESILPSNKYLRIFLVPFLITPITLIGLIASKILPKNEGLYLNNVVVAKKC